MEKTMISPGSMLNTSEGIFCVVVNAMMSAALAAEVAWPVQVAAVVMAGICTTAYVVSRQKAKMMGEAGE